MSLERINASPSVLSTRRRIRPSELAPTKVRGGHGARVRINPQTAPIVLKHLVNVVGTWQNQIGEYTHVLFPQIGVVSVPSAVLIVESV